MCVSSSATRMVFSDMTFSTRLPKPRRYRTSSPLAGHSRPSLWDDRQGQLEPETVSRSRAGFDKHAAAVHRLDDPSDQRETHARATRAAGAGLRLIELIEHRGHVLGLDARPVVANCGEHLLR